LELRILVHSNELLGFIKSGEIVHGVAAGNVGSTGHSFSPGGKKEKKRRNG
jgi:hypothetical protein